MENQETKKRGKKPFQDRSKVKKGIVIYLRQNEIEQLGGNAAVRKKIYDSLNS